jgi:cell wall-associated NlpC family hydrolase
VTEREQREAVVAEARDWIGTKFHFGSSIKGVGVACGPFLIACYAPYARDAGLTLPTPPPFARDWHFHTNIEKFRDVVAGFCRQVEAPLPGDLALFRLGAKTRPWNHGAIVIDWPTKVIHAQYRSGVEYADVTRDVVLRTASEASFWSPWGFSK